jgi:maltose alpha-D-glucosyltransferase/alpha-amylase
MMDRDYPQAALISEWSNPALALCQAGFHAEFYLDHQRNGYNTLLRDYETEGGDHSYFLKDAGGDIRRFLQDYLPKYEQTKDCGYISFITCNHDTPRPARTLSVAELKLAYAFILTMPGVPFIYYGDEIGMKYLDVPTKEGGYFRTGSRTPMQWNSGKNLGFSEADAADLYLPVDDAPDAPNVEDAMKDPDSLYHTVKDLIALRHANKDLQANTYCEVIYAEKEKFPFIYKRGSFIMVLNPSRETMTNIIPAGFAKVYGIGDIEALPVDESDVLKVGPQSFAVFKATTEKAREAAIAWKQ